MGFYLNKLTTADFFVQLEVHFNMSFRVLATMLIALVLVAAREITATQAETSTETRESCSQLEGWLLANLTEAQAEIKSLKTNSQSCVRYSFRFTHQKANFDAARQMCRDLGGDLIHENLKPSGIEYHNLIREMVSSTNNDAWIGLKDHIVEEDWRLLNGERFDASDHSQPSLYFWKAGEPNSDNDNEDCAEVVGSVGAEGFNDTPCHIERHGLCEMKHDICL